MYRGRLSADAETIKQQKEMIPNKNIATTFVEFQKKNKVYFIPVLSYSKIRPFELNKDTTL
jgi:hypothetical protein